MEIENTMVISPIQIAQIDEKIKYYQGQNAHLEKESTKLTQVVLQNRQELELMKKNLEELYQAEKKIQKDLNAAAQAEIQQMEKQVKECSDLAKKEYLSELERIKKKGNYRKRVEMEKKIMENLAKRWQLEQFQQEVKSLYAAWNRQKKQPTTQEIIKWISEDNINPAYNFYNVNTIVAANAKKKLTKKASKKNQNKTIQTKQNKKKDTKQYLNPKKVLKKGNPKHTKQLPKKQTQKVEKKNNVEVQSEQLLGSSPRQSPPTSNSNDILSSLRTEEEVFSSSENSSKILEGPPLVQKMIAMSITDSQVLLESKSEVS